MILIENQPPGGNCVDALVAWLVLVPREYIDMVSERKGEALVILAYFGALVNTHKEKWVFCDGGKYLVESIGQHLGAPWEEWLYWPYQTLTVTESIQ